MIVVPADFVSDGCTGFVDKWRGIDLLPCCREHDYLWFLNPDNWWVWLTSNVDLGLCFAHAGAVELVGPAIALTCSVGALLFAGFLKIRRGRSNGE